MTEPASPSVQAIRVAGSAVVYRLYDVGYEVRLESAASLLASGPVARARPRTGRDRRCSSPTRR